MAGYARQSSADIVATAVVRANPLNVEFNALRDTFALATGHTHDGSATEGGYVPLIADSDALNKIAIDTSNNRVGIFVEVSNAAVEQIRIQDGAIVPVTDSDIDLGTSSLEFKDLFLDGTAHIDTLDVDANAGIIGNLTVSGNTTLGDAASDTVTVTADVASPLIPSTDDTYDLGASGSEWRNLYIDGTANIDALVADTADINGGTADGVVIGGSSAAAGTFTSLTATGTSTLTTVDINGGAIDGAIIGANSAAAITGTTITGTSLVGAVTGNADTATALETARTIGGVSFDGTANINLPGVNTSGNQDTSGTAANATVLETARTIGGVSFDGSANINLSGVNTAGNQDTSGNAATATTLATARTIAGQSFNGSANITIAATDLSDTDQSLATGDNVQFASVTGNLTGNVTSTGANSFGSLTVSGAATLNGNTIIGNAATDTVTVTADVASNLIPSADSSYSLGDSSNYWSHGYIDAVTTTGNVIVGGDLTVNGTTTTVATTNMTVSDALIELGTGTTGTPVNDAGIVIERGDAANAFMGYDESADKFTVGTGTFTGASTGNLSITTGTLVANVEGNVTGNVTGSSGSTTGNAATATALETARTVGGVSFDGTANIDLPGVNASGTQDTSGNADTATALATARTIAGQSFDGTGNISIAPTDLTGVNSTATELNIMDGNTSASSTTLADADRVVVNDNGTMKQVPLTDFETYMETSLDTLSNVTTVGALNSGSITSGFGSINVGNSDITTAGRIIFGRLSGVLSGGADNVTNIVTSVDTGSDNSELATAGAIESRIQAVNSASNNVTGLNATGAEINTVADFSAVSVDTSTAIANNDALLVFDNGNEIGYRDVDLLDTYFSGTTKTLTNKTLTSPIVTGLHLNDSGFTVEGSAADGNDTTVAFTNPTATRTITLPNATGHIPVFATAPSAAISDGSSGQFLTTDGSGALSFATVESGADLYAENPSSATAPSATGSNAVAIGDGVTSSGVQSIGLGADSTASGNYSVALGRGVVSSNTFSTAVGYGSDATSSGAAALGYNSQAVTGANATALTNSYASGADSFAAAIANNTSSYGATGGHSLAMGWGAKATSSQSVSLGGFYSQATDNYAVTLGGSQNTASGAYSVAISGSTNVSSGNYSSVLGGQSNTASGSHSVAMGYYANASIIGKSVFASGRFSANGDAQSGTFVLRSDTTDATAEALTTNNSTAGSTNQIVAASDTCITFHGTVVAMQNGAQAHAGWEIKGMLVNDGGTTTLALGNVSDMAATNASSWAVALSADNTNNALKIQVTGEASHNIRWVANVQTSEVTYA